MESSETTIKTLSENDLWMRWYKASPEVKPRYAPALLKSLQKHAHSVVWLRLRETRPEIVDEAVWKAFEKASAFKGDSAFTTWFHRIILNCCTDYLRAKQSRGEVSLEGIGEGIADPKSDAAIELRQLTAPLRARQKRLISLKLEGLSDAEIGKILGIKELAVRHFWTRTKERIRDNAGYSRKD